MRIPNGLGPGPDPDPTDDDQSTDSTDSDLPFGPQPAPDDGESNLSSDTPPADEVLPGGGSPSSDTPASTDTDASAGGTADPSEARADQSPPSDSGASPDNSSDSGTGGSTPDPSEAQTNQLAPPDPTSGTASSTSSGAGSSPDPSETRADQSPEPSSNGTETGTTGPPERSTPDPSEQRTNQQSDDTDNSGNSSGRTASSTPDPSDRRRTDPGTPPDPPSTPPTGSTDSNSGTTGGSDTGSGSDTDTGTSTGGTSEGFGDTITGTPEGETQPADRKTTSAGVTITNETAGEENALSGDNPLVEGQVKQLKSQIKKADDLTFGDVNFTLTDSGKVEVSASDQLKQSREIQSVFQSATDGTDASVVETSDDVFKVTDDGETKIVKGSDADPLKVEEQLEQLSGTAPPEQQTVASNTDTDTEPSEQGRERAVDRVDSLVSDDGGAQGAAAASDLPGDETTTNASQDVLDTGTLGTATGGDSAGETDQSPQSNPGVGRFRDRGGVSSTAPTGDTTGEGEDIFGQIEAGLNDLGSDLRQAADDRETAQDDLANNTPGSPATVLGSAGVSRLGGEVQESLLKAGAGLTQTPDVAAAAADQVGDLVSSTVVAGGSEEEFDETASEDAQQAQQLLAQTVESAKNNPQDAAVGLFTGAAVSGGASVLTRGSRLGRLVGTDSSVSDAATGTVRQTGDAVTPSTPDSKAFREFLDAERGQADLTFGKNGDSSSGSGGDSGVDLDNLPDEIAGTDPVDPDQSQIGPEFDTEDDIGAADAFQRRRGRGKEDRGLSDRQKREREKATSVSIDTTPIPRQSVLDEIPDADLRDFDTLDRKVPDSDLRTRTDTETGTDTPTTASGAATAAGGIAGTAPLGTGTDPTTGSDSDSRSGGEGVFGTPGTEPAAGTDPLGDTDQRTETDTAVPGVGRASDSDAVSDFFGESDTETAIDTDTGAFGGLPGFGDTDLGTFGNTDTGLSQRSDSDTLVNQDRDTQQQQDTDTTRDRDGRRVGTAQDPFDPDQRESPNPREEENNEENEQLFGNFGLNDELSSTGIADADEVLDDFF